MNHPIQPFKYVMLIEDDADIREVINLALEYQGYEVKAFSNGQHALNYLESHTPPCVILLDLMMPIMNGWEFLHALQETPRHTSIPIVVLSAADRLPMPLSGLQVNAYLPKPINIQALFDLVERYASTNTPLDINNSVRH